MRSLAQTFNLAEPSFVGEAGVKVTTKEVEEERKRVKKSELEWCLLKDPVISNGINLLKNIFMHAGYRIECKDADAQSFMTSFRKKRSLDETLSRIFQDTAIYGNAWTEIVYNKKKNRIVDLDVLDPKRMDFQKERGYVKIDNDNRPAGYIQKVKGYHIPDKVKNKIKQIGGERGIPLSKEKTAHFTLTEFGSGFYGVGLIEPIYKITRSKLNLLEIMEVSARKSTPGRIIMSGDENHEPTADQMEDTLNQFVEADYDEAVIMAYYNDIKELEGSQNLGDFISMLEFYIKQQVTGMGMPLALATGSGEETNRATLGTQEQILERIVRGYQRRISAQLRNQVFEVMAKLENWNDVPKIVWNEISLENLQDLSKRFERYINSGLLEASDNIKKIIRQKEGLPMEG